MKWTQRKALCDDFPQGVQLQLGSQSESRPGSQPPSRAQLGFQPQSRLQSQSWLPSPFPLLSTQSSDVGSGVSVSSTSMSPVWMSGSGLSSEDEDVLLQHLGSSVRDSTRRTYTGYWNRFKSFCENRRVSILPAAPAVVARFLITIAEANASVSGAKSAVSAISFYHKMFMGDAISPTDSVVVKNIMRSLSEKYAKPVKKANPFSSMHLKSLLDFYFSLTSVSTDDTCVMTMIVTMFSLMARHEEVAKLTKECVKSLDSGDLEITFPSAKNYNFSDSKKSFLAFCPNATYNVAFILSSYVDSLPPGSLLFPMSYSSALSKVRDLLSRAFVSVGTSFSLHSFRVGAVSESVNSGLISDSDIQRHARWNSLEMLYRYRCQTLESQLKASRLLLISRV